MVVAGRADARGREGHNPATSSPSPHQQHPAEHGTASQLPHTSVALPGSAKEQLRIRFFMLCVLWGSRT